MIEDNSIYIYILWAKSRHKQSLLIDKISARFQILTVYEIKWSNENFYKNLKRFYGTKLNDVDKKIQEIGKEPFLLLVIHDKNPIFEKRRTSLGMEIVNVNIFNFKKYLRKLLDNGFLIHSSLNFRESNEDLTMLLGKNLKDLKYIFSQKWDGKFIQINNDLVGSDGWINAQNLFYVLNSLNDYVVLRNFENLDCISKYSHDDIDILTNDIGKIPYHCNGGKSLFDKYFTKQIKIENKLINLDFLYPGDNYYDPKWYRDILNHKILKNGIFVPSDEDYFFTLLYHSLKIRKELPLEYKNKLIELNQKLDLRFQNFSDIPYLIDSLEKYMKFKGYLDTNSIIFRLKNIKPIYYLKFSISIWKNHGFRFLVNVINNKFNKIFSR